MTQIKAGQQPASIMAATDLAYYGFRVAARWGLAAGCAIILCLAELPRPILARAAAQTRPQGPPPVVSHVLHLAAENQGNCLGCAEVAGKTFVVIGSAYGLTVLGLRPRHNPLSWRSVSSDGHFWISLPDLDAVNCIAINPLKGRVVFGTIGGAVEMCQLSPLRKLWSRQIFSHDGPVTGLCVLDGGAKIGVAGYSGMKGILGLSPAQAKKYLIKGAIVILDAKTGAVVRRIGASSLPYLSLCAVGRSEVVTSIDPKPGVSHYSNRVHFELWNWRTGTCRRRMVNMAGKLPAWRAVALPGKRLAAVCGYRSLVVRSLSPGAKALHVRTTGNWQNTLAVSPNGRLIATPMSGGGAQLWDAKTLHLVATLGNVGRVNQSTLAGIVTEIAFTPHGRYVLTLQINRAKVEAWRVPRNAMKDAAPMK